MTTEQARFAFTIQGLPEDAFLVVRFTGTEGLSKLYAFDIALLSAEGSVDMDAALAGDACLTVRGADGEQVSWRGVLRDFQQLQRVDGRVFYRAVLVPRAYALCQNLQSRIFLDSQTPQIIQEVLAGVGLSSGHDYDMRTLVPYPVREYVCQYNETDFAFLSRQMERSGVYFYFDHSGAREKLLVADHLNTHASAPPGCSLVYREVSGMAPPDASGSCSRLSLECKRLPKEIQLRDHNYRIPDVVLESKAGIAPSGAGGLALHDGNIRSMMEAKYLASVRAQTYQCRRKLFTGESDSPSVQPGWTFTLRDHFESGWNMTYLPLEVKHEGSQEAWLASGLGIKGFARADAAGKLFYRNSFSAIPAATQYRPELKTPRPWIAGVLHARIDAEGAGEYAELDDQGRYKVVMPFDLSGRHAGHATTWLRMIQPYGGQGHGMHFPLHKGTEVALVHEEGDPDRPVIAGAVPNPAARSVVTSANQTQSRIATAGGNHLSMEDLEGSQCIVLQSPTASSFLRLGSKNPTDWSTWGTSDGVALKTGAGYEAEVQAYNLVVFGDYSQTTVGFQSYDCVGGNLTVNLGADITLTCAVATEFDKAKYELRPKVRKAEADKEAVLGKMTEFMDANTQIINDSIRVVQELGEVIDTQQHVVANLKQEIAQQSQTVANLDQTYMVQAQLVANLDQKIGDQIKTVGNLEQTIASKTLTAGELTHTAGNMTTIADAHTQTVSEDTHMNLSNTLLTGDMQVI
ncbi:Actin cross-linking toxin VgrG1 [Fundidesulfovibrio magnetotacticus]|uniref:Actin cross-linking toxin VgrG1 n=1 Tax=Fundidesulfovibrio magnetotacticus TaxID=2730080 RepID=A0A6V8LY66_9BACT|nr:type VI secretion system tip protein TssI/VgrG [Fundidesulfovibrio magnetotacticus]GFK95770.1 Actin cross-linking toxin VgrG1 [Fundidesulfovibrio magnetotacticus]